MSVKAYLVVNAAFDAKNRRDNLISTSTDVAITTTSTSPHAVTVTNVGYSLDATDKSLRL